jgi:hypothetical protein
LARLQFGFGDVQCQGLRALIPLLPRRLQCTMYNVRIWLIISDLISISTFFELSSAPCYTITACSIQHAVYKFRAMYSPGSIDSDSNSIMTGSQFRFEWSFSRRHFACFGQHIHIHIHIRTPASIEYNLQHLLCNVSLIDYKCSTLGFIFDRSMIHAVRIIVSMPNSARIRIQKLSRQGLN